MDVAIKVVVVPEDLQGLKKAYVLKQAYVSEEEIQIHLGRAADELANSSCREVCESDQVRNLMVINKDFASFWDISHCWYDELTNSLMELVPDLADKIVIWAKNERFDALLRIKW